MLCLIKPAKWVEPTFAAQYKNIELYLASTKKFVLLIVNYFTPGDTRYAPLSSNKCIVATDLRNNFL